MKNQMHNRIFSILLALCMLVSLLPAGMLSASAVSLEQEYVFLAPNGTATLTTDESVTLVSSNEDVVTVDGGVITAIGAGTATVTANDGAATAYVVVDDNPHFYYNIGKAFQGHLSSNVVAFTDMGYAQTTKGSPDEVVCENGYMETDPWKAGTQTAGAQATIYAFNAGSAQDSLYMRGYDFINAADTDYTSVIVKVPAAGTYDVKIHHVLINTNPSVIKFAPAGVGVDNATTLGALNSYFDVTSTLNGFTTTLNQVTVESAGEYEFFITGETKGIWIDAIELINVDAPYVEPEFVVTEAVCNEVITPKVTVPDGYTLTISSDSDLVTVNDDNTITCGTQTGSALVKFSTEENPAAYSTMLIDITGITKFNYIKAAALLDPIEDQKVLVNTVSTSTSQMKTYSDHDVDPNRQFISYGWMAPASSVWAMNPSTVNPGLGLYFTSNAGTYNSMVIDVPADGRYQIYSKHSLWNAGGAQFDLYIAPTEDAANIISDQYKVTAEPFNVTFAAGDAARLYSFYAGAATLEAGSYTVAYQVVTQGSGFFVGGIELRNALSVSEIEATSLNLTAASTFIQKGSTTYLTTAVEPAEAKAWVTYESSDDTIATVDANGVVTGTGAGTATITATAGDLTETVDITVWDKVYDYAFHALSAAFKAEGNASNVSFASDTYKTEGWYENYSEITSPWLYDSASGDYFVSDPSGTYGSFSLNATAGSFVTIKVTLEEGEYSPELVQNMAVNASATQGAADVNLYVAPVSASNKKDASYKVLNVAAHDSGVQTDRATETFKVAAGDYLITLENAGRGRYSYLHNIRLYRVGEVKVESFDLTAASDMVKVNETTTVSATNIVPSYKTIAGATWTSSDDTIATVDANGVVTGHKMGKVTITATLGDVSASVDVTVVGEIYNYLFKDMPSTNFLKDSTFKSEDYADSKNIEGCAPFRYINSAGGTALAGQATYSTFFFGVDQSTSGFIQFEVELEEGVYSASAVINAYRGSSDANVYLAPVDAAAIETEDNFIMHITDGDNLGTPAKKYENGTETVAVKGGKYYLYFRQAPDTNESPEEENGPTQEPKQNDDRYLCLDSFTLYKVADVKVESFELIPAVDLLKADDSTTISATNIVPYFETIDGAVWSSSDDDIATVVDGVVTGVSAGTATITAEIDGVSASTDITVYSNVHEYKFREVGNAYNGTGSGTTVFKDNAAFTGTYDGSQTGNTGSAKWMYVSSTSSFQSDNTYGSFFFGAQNGTIDSVVLKIKVEEDGEYIPASTRHIYGSSTSATVHIAPVADELHKTNDKYYVYTISDAGANGTNAEEIADTSLMLKAGEYYLTFHHAVPSSGTDRYLCLHDFRLYNVGEFVDIKVESISASTNMAALAVGETTTMGASILPTSAANKILTWSSSDENIATVDAVTGVVTAKANGIVTITATATDGSNVSGSKELVVGGTYTYDFVKSITALPDYKEGETYKVKDDKLSVDYQDSIDAGSAPWYLDTRSTEPNHAEISYNKGNAAHGAFFFGTKNASGYLCLKIKVEESGVYTGALRYSDYNGTAPTTVYFVPVEKGTENIISDETLIFDIPQTSMPLVQKGVTTDDLYLSKGEYYLYFKQNGDPNTTLEHRYLTVHYFSLTKTDDFGLTLTDGASMRTKGEQGLRFYAQLDKTTDLFKAGRVKESGILLLPTEDLACDTDLTLGYVAANGHMVAKVPAVNKMYTSTEEMDEFTAVLIGIPEASYTRNISARAYAIIEDENGVEHTIYSDVVASRSLEFVAQAILDDKNATNSEKNAAQAVIDAIASLGGSSTDESTEV